MDDIEGVQEKYQGKKNHFLIKLKTHEMHLKCDDQKEADAWVEAINNLLQVFKGKKLVNFDIDRKYKDKLDVRVQNLIMKELECKNLFIT